MKKYIKIIPVYLLVLYIGYWVHKTGTCSYVIEKAKEESFEGRVVYKGTFSFNKGHYVDVKERSGKIISLSSISVEHTNQGIWYAADVGDFVKKRAGANKYYLIKKDTTLTLFRDSLYDCTK